MCFITAILAGDMIHQHYEHYDEYTADFINMGAGSANSITATLIAEHQFSHNTYWSVILIEEGIDPRNLPDSDIVYNPDRANSAMQYPPIRRNYTSTPQSFIGNNTYETNRGMGLGGSHLMNSMWWCPGDPYRYNSFGVSGWSYADLLPHIRSVRPRVNANYVPIGLASQIQERTMQAIVNNTAYERVPDYIPPVKTIIGVQRRLQTMNQENSINATRATSFDRFVRASPRLNKNLFVHSSIRINRFDVSSNGTIGVIYATNKTNGREVRYKYRIEPIIGLGTYDTPRIVQLSGIGNFTKLASYGIESKVNNTHIGQNLYYHNVALVIGDVEPGFTSFPAPLSKWHSGIAVGAAIRPEGNNATHIGNTLNAIIDIYQSSDLTSFQTSVGVGLNTEDFGPGEVNVNASNPLKPLIDTKLYERPHELQFMIEVYRETRRLLSAVPWYNKFEYSPGDSVQTDEDFKQFLAARQIDGAHPVGTMALGLATNNKAIVKGTNLRVSDVSLAPRSVGCNTNGLAHIIGSKVASLIIKKYD